MKIQDWTKLLLAAALALALASCKHPTPKTGEGGAIEDTGETIDPIAQDSMGGDDPTAGPRLTSKDGFEWGKWESIHFGFDSATVQTADQATLEQIAKWLKENSDGKIQIAGNCDERGTTEYNLSLGQRRAAAARNYLIKLGVAGSRIATVSWGEEKPVDAAHNEDAWAKNRRADFGLTK